MVVNVFPDAVVVTAPQSRVEGVTRDRSTGDLIDILYRADVGDARRVPCTVKDVDARINQVTVTPTASRRLVLCSPGCGVIKVKSLESFAFRTLHPATHRTLYRPARYPATEGGRGAVPQICYLPVTPTSSRQSNKHILTADILRSKTSLAPVMFCFYSVIFSVLNVTIVIRCCALFLFCE